jgi:hypothetical protein
LTIEAWRVSELALLFSPSWIASQGHMPASTKIA